MAAFASCRRSGWVRVLVVILCALFIFATVATPPAYAVGETAALFGAAAVLSAAVAALGFKLSNDADGISTLNKMVSDFAKEAWALNLLVVGNRINGLIDGMNYIKMAVHNGKTYLDERVVAWCQQWLGNNGVYDAGGYVDPSFNEGDLYKPSVKMSVNQLLSLFPSSDAEKFSSVISHFNLDLNNRIIEFQRYYYNRTRWVVFVFPNSVFNKSYSVSFDSFGFARTSFISGINGYSVDSSNNFNTQLYTNPLNLGYYSVPNEGHSPTIGCSNAVLVTQSSNNTGLSGTDTIGEDYKDKTLDQILAGLKTWAQDWYDAGADSATNTATGALDLPVTVGDQAATANPALNPDVVYNPPFSIPWPGVRSGETSSGAISDGKANADAAQTATTDVAENQTIIDSLVNWALNYINPDTGLFSKFPLCVPYDAYLLVTSSLGVDAVGSDSIFGASPGDLEGVVSQDIETYSDFQPIINIKHDFELDGATYPLELTIDLTPWQPLVTFFREGMALLLVAELIGAEFKRIRGH